MVFNDPIANEVDVRRTVVVRLQFSRDMAATTFENRVRVSYTEAGKPSASPPPDFAVRYDEGKMALEIRFAAPLERDRTVKVELLEGITARDGTGLAAWTLAFHAGLR